MQSPWHYTTFLDLLEHWQSLIAGLLALIAAGVAVFGTMRIERRKAKIELEALRSSVAVELRIVIARAYGAHVLLKELARQTNSITTLQVDSFSQMPVPVVYPATADKIGLLGDSAMEVVMFYGTVEVVTAKANQLQWFRTPDNISSPVIAGLGNGFLMACKSSLPILSKLKTSVALHDSRDAELIQLIEAATPTPM